MVQLRICTKCGEEKEISEFYKTNHNKIGRFTICKMCVSKRHKKHYENNKEEAKTKSAEYYLNNKEHINNRNKEWYKENKEYILEQHKIWKENNEEQCTKTNEIWRKNNKEQCTENRKNWIKNNPEKHSIICRRKNDKRRRNFGFIPLNEKFPGSVGHHISKDLVIFIPEELHKSVPHRYNDPTSMGEINGLALEFMMPEVG